MSWHLRIFLLISVIYLHAQESLCLRNIRQATDSSMGFEKAGEAYFSPDGNSIIFQGVPKGETEYQIFTMELNGGAPRLVSTGKGSCTCGYFRPDGKKILFASTHEAAETMEKKERPPGKYIWDLTPYMNIYEADLDGSNLRRITNGPAYHAECAYSPDGREIVYASNEDGGMNLYVCQSDGQNVRQLTHTQGCYNGGPFFSPDGMQIVFRADRLEAHHLQLFVMRADGSEERQITNDGFVNWAPYWHPCGDVIAYTTSRHGHHAYQIYLINVDTGEERRLTESSVFEGLPAFSKDGTKMAWTSKRGGGSPQVFIAEFELPPNLSKRRAL